MDARPLDMLHNAGDKVIRAVADRIHLDLFAHHVLVDQHRIFELMEVMMVIYSRTSLSS